MVCFDSFQQFFRWFVGGVLGDELAGKGAGEEGRRDKNRKRFSGDGWIRISD
jgi:hypothetical protein